MFGKNYFREKTLDLKTTVELVTQNSYDRRDKQSTLPPALAVDKEIKQKPIPKTQAKQYREQQKQPMINNCGFCGQQNWTPQHNCPAKTVKMQQLPENRALCTGMSRKTKQHYKINQLSRGDNIRRQRRK